MKTETDTAPTPAQPTISFFFRWYDLWIGAYYDTKPNHLYICPLPTIEVKIHLDSIRCIFGHSYSGWLENLSRHAIGSRYRMCSRCGKIELGEYNE